MHSFVFEAASPIPDLPACLPPALQAARNVHPEEGPVEIATITGPLLQEVRQSFADWAQLTTRLWQGASHVEVSWAGDHGRQQNRQGHFCLPVRLRTS